jgi:acyl-coenzyme A synthetase/AMP-(fatty) acid ligase
MSPESATTKSSNIADLILRQAQHQPDAPAIVVKHDVISYQQLYNMVATVAARMTNAGVTSGDMVGLSFMQSPNHIIAMLAVAHVGAVSVPLHPGWSPTMRQATAARYKVTHLLARHERYRLEGIGFTTLSRETLSSSGITLPPPYPLDEDKPFRLVLTSGTTGAPKGVMFSHGYMRKRVVRTGCVCTRASRLFCGDFNVTVGFVFALSVLASGGVLVIPVNDKPDDMIRAINLYAITNLIIAPSLAIPVARQLPGKGMHFPTLQHISIVGGAPSRSLLEDLRTRFSPNVVVHYGTSELGLIALATPEILAQHPESAGKIVPWARVEIVDDAGMSLPVGSHGQVRVAFDGMPTNYYDDEARSAEHFREGWCYPGDLGRLDAQGLLYIEGRSDNLLNIDGNRVNPAIIENVLTNHPQVEEAIVMSLPASENLPESLIAAVVHTGSPPENLHEYCAERIVGLLPAQFIFMKDFPRNPSGKVLRGQLMSIIKEGLTARSQKNVK